MISVKRLAVVLDITPDIAKQVRSILDAKIARGERAPWEADSADYQLLHDTPSRKLYAIDRLVPGFHGVETIPSCHDTLERFRGVSYLNTGDSYATTLCYDHGHQKWLLNSWGDLVERQPKRFGL